MKISNRTILLDVSGRADSCIIVVEGGRIILEQLERDSPPVFGAGVTIRSGSFRGISGAGHCPTFGRNSVILQVELADDRAEETGQVHRPVMSEEWAAAVERRHQRRADAGLM